MKSKLTRYSIIRHILYYSSQFLHAECIEAYENPEKQNHLNETVPSLTRIQSETQAIAEEANHLEKLLCIENGQLIQVPNGCFDLKRGYKMTNPLEIYIENKNDDRTSIFAEECKTGSDKDCSDTALRVNLTSMNRILILI